MTNVFSRDMQAKPILIKHSYHTAALLCQILDREEQPKARSH